MTGIHCMSANEDDGGGDDGGDDDGGGGNGGGDGGPDAGDSVLRRNVVGTGGWPVNYIHLNTLITEQKHMQ